MKKYEREQIEELGVLLKQKPAAENSDQQYDTSQLTTHGYMMKP